MWKSTEKADYQYAAKKLYFTLKPTHSAANSPTSLQIQPVYGLKRIWEHPPAPRPPQKKDLQATSWAKLWSRALQMDRDRQTDTGSNIQCYHLLELDFPTSKIGVIQHTLQHVSGNDR